jgi:quinol monooxygenase YgiN
MTEINKAKALVKVNVRGRASLFETLQAQHSQRMTHGELSFSLWVDDNKRNICFVMLEWESLRSLNRFLESPIAKEFIDQWPIEEALEIRALYDLTEVINKP